MKIRTSTLLERGLNNWDLRALESHGLLRKAEHADLMRTTKPPSSWPRWARAIWQKQATN